MLQPGRKYSSAGSGYRYGFNGKENDNEVKGEGNQQDYGMRIYDPRLGRFLSVDPISKQYPELTPYQFASDRPVEGVDQDGLEFERVLIRLSFQLASEIDQNADKVKEKKSQDPNYKYTTADKIILFGNGLSKSTPFGAAHQIDKKFNAIRNASPEQRKQIHEQALDQTAYFIATIVKKGPIEGSATIVADTYAPVVKGALKGDLESLGELTGTGVQLWAPFKFSTRSSGLGDLTKAEVNTIQKVVDKAQRPLEVVGSAAKGTRRGVGSSLPIGKGPGTKSDIDYISHPAHLPYLMELQKKLPNIDPKHGISPGTINPFIGPGIRFEPGSKPSFIPSQAGN